MCIAVPSKIIKIEGMTATIDVQGAQRQVSLMLLPCTAEIGDYVLIHAGFAIQKLDPEAGRETLELFKEMTASNPRNIHWGNLKPGSGRPLLPHMEMYRSALERFLEPGDLERLANKRLEFLMAKFPRFLPSTLGTLLAFTIYGLEKHLTGVLHPSWTRKLGFQPLARGNRDAEDISDLIDAILASSCVPPVLPGDGYRGQRVLDGGVIDNVPAHLADGREGRTLVLLSKRYKRPLPEPGQRVYVQPGETIRIDKFDYANPIGLQETYDIGFRDGAGFAASVY